MVHIGAKLQSCAQLVRRFLYWNQLVFILLSVFLSACERLTGTIVQLSSTLGSANSISGTVLPLSASGSSLAHKSVAILSCSTGEASLYRLDNSGAPEMPALASVSVASDGTYQFPNLRSLGASLSTAKYIIDVKACTNVYRRIVTGNSSQDISVGTTLVGFILNSPQAASVVNADQATLKILLENMKSYSDYTTAYTHLSTDGAESSRFQSLFGALPSVVLNDVSPLMASLVAPTSGQEGETLALNMELVHWKPSYSYAFLWSVDGQTISTSRNATYIPSGNSQGARVITAYFGQQDGSGNLDSSKPFQSQSVTIPISNDILPQPPVLSVVGSNLVGSPLVNLSIATGAGFINCDSFSSLALTEEDPIAPSAASAYNITCTQAGTQSFSYNLTTGVGAKTLRLWARDASGNISSTARSVSVVYSLVIPAVSITSPSASGSYQGSVTIAGACDDSAGDVSLSGNITSSPVLTACSTGSFSEVVNLAGVDGLKTITASQTNSFGNSGSDTVSLNKDTAAPTVSLSSAVSNSTNLATIPVTVTFSEVVTGLDISDLSLVNGTASNFAGSGSSYSFDLLPSSPGTVSVNIASNAAQDLAGNGSSAASTLTRLYDTTQPTVTLASTASNPTNSGTLPVSVTFSEAVTAFSLSGVSVSNGTASSLAGSGTNYTFSVTPSGQGVVSVTINAGAAQDAASNSNLVSSALSRTYDSIAPTVALSSTAPDPTNNSPIPVTLLFSESVSGLTLAGFTVTNGTAASLTGSGTSYSLDITPSGAGTISVRVNASAAQDASGNFNTASSNLTRVFNNAKPLVTVASTRSSPTKESTIPVTITFSSSVTGFDSSDVALTNGTLSNFSGSAASYSFDVTPSGQGAVAISVPADVAQDGATNNNLASNNLSIVYDTVAPTLAVTAPANSSYINLANENALSVSGTCSENGRTINLQLGSVVGSASCTSGSFSTTLDAHTLSDGAVTLTANLSDAAGNAATPVVVNLIKDTSSPTATLAGTPSSPNKTVALDITVSGTSVTHYKYKLGAASSVDCASSSGYSTEIAAATHITDNVGSISDGSVQLCVVGRNAAGNYQAFASATTATWVKDTVVTPFTGLAVAPGAKGNNNKPTISGASEGLAAVEMYSLAGCGGVLMASSTAASGGAFTLTPSSSIGSDGAYTFSVLARDTANNTLCSSNIAYTLDTVAPTVTITSTAPMNTNTSPIPVSIVFSENVTGFTSSSVTVTNGTVSGFTGSGTTYSFNIAPTAQGTVTVSVAANSGVDGAANGNLVSSVLTRSYDTLAPVFTITAPSNNSYTTLAALTFTGACETGLAITISGSGLSSPTTATCSSSAYSVAVNLTAGDGVKNISLSQADAAGNSTSVSRAITKDTLAPALTFTSVGVQTQVTNTNTATFTGGCETDRVITVSGSDSGSTACTSSSWSYTTTAQATDGNRSYTFTQTDLAGNATAVTGTWTRDATVPVVSLTSLGGGQYLKGGSTAAITWTATDANLISTPISLDYSSNAGSTWTSIATNLANSGSYSWTVPSLNGSSFRVRVSAKDAVNTGTSASASSFSIDSSAPIVTLGSLNGGQLLKGGSTVNITWTATDNNLTSTPIAIDYSADGGSTWTSIATAQTYTSGANGSYTWTVPSVTGTNYKVRVTAVDRVAFTSSAVSASPFAIDSAAPTLSLTSLTGGQTIAGSGASRAITWSAVDANFASNPITIDYSANGGSTWINIVSNIANSGSYNWTVSVADGTSYRVRVTAVDSVGNSATASSASNFVVSSAVPNLTQTTLSSPVVTGTSTGVTFGGACDLSATMGTASTDITVSGAATATIACTGSAPTGTWTYTTPSQGTDGTRTYNFAQTTEGGLTTQISSVWIRDAVAPQVTAVVINNGDTYLNTTMAAVAVTALDAAYTTGLQVRIAAVDGAATDCQALYADDNWNQQINSTMIWPTMVSDSDGVKKVCAWAKDKAGNVSVISPASGTLNTDMDTVQYANSSPPQVLAFEVVNPSNNSTTYASGDNVKISWTVGDSLGLANDPISLEYTTNGTTWTAIEAAYGGLSGNPTSYTASYYGFNAPSSGFFRVRIAAKNVTGQTSLKIVSSAQNSGQWSVYAGTEDRGVGGAARSLLVTKTNNATNGFFVFAPKSNDLYLIDEGYNLIKVDAKTGLSSVFIVNGTTNLTDGGTITSSSRLETKAAALAFDSKGYLYISAGSLVTQSAVIWKIDLATMKTSKYLGNTSATAFDSSATPSSAFVFTGQFTFDESDSLYFVTSCSPGTWDYNSGSTSTSRIMKVTQKADGTAGVVSVVAGNCVRGEPVSGTLATNSPLTTNLYLYARALTVWNNGASIYYRLNASSTYKILNGTIYPTALYNTAVGHLVYSPKTNKLYMAAVFLEEWNPSLSGANGETRTAYVTSANGTGNCTADGVLGSSACVNANNGIGLTSQNTVVFADGIDASGGFFRLRYVDSSGLLRTLAGSLPFSGDGLNKALLRSPLNGIYYKKSHEPNQTAFPEGLYFRSSGGPVFGRIGTDGIVRNLWGNQSGVSLGSAYANGTTVSSSLSMGGTGFSASAMLAFDGQGLPWLAYGRYLVSLDANGKTVTRSTSASGDFSISANTAGGFAYTAGFQNLIVKDQGVFLFGRYYSATNTNYLAVDPVLRFFNYQAQTITHIMGNGTPTMSPDSTSAGSVAGLGFSNACINANCAIQYDSSIDTLYFSDGNVLRSVTQPLTPANNFLKTEFTASSFIRNFILTDDRTQVFYILDDGKLRCHALTVAGNRSWCNDAILGPSTGLYVLSKSPNQMTWKDSTTLLISTSRNPGEVYQYSLPAIP